MDKVAKLREVFNKTLGEKDKAAKLSVNDFVLKAVACALTDVPEANSAWLGEVIRQYKKADISVAVATPAGLITPIIKDVGSKGLATISAEGKALAKKARDGKLQPLEYQGGTFTVSNLGMFGIDHFTAIINPPQSCILAVGATHPTLVPAPEEERGFKVAQIMKDAGNLWQIWDLGSICLKRVGGGVVRVVLTRTLMDEPEFVGQQVNSLYTTVKNNVGLLDKHGQVEERIIVEPDFVLQQIQSLYTAVGDSVRLFRQQDSSWQARQKQKLLVMQPQFLQQQNSSGSGPETRTCYVGYRIQELVTASPTFLLQQVESLYAAVKGSAKLLSRNDDLERERATMQARIATLEHELEQSKSAAVAGEDIRVVQVEVVNLRSQLQDAATKSAKQEAEKQQIVAEYNKTRRQMQDMADEFAKARVRTARELSDAETERKRLVDVCDKHEKDKALLNRDLLAHHLEEKTRWTNENKAMQRTIQENEKSTHSLVEQIVHLQAKLKKLEEYEDLAQQREAEVTRYKSQLLAAETRNAIQAAELGDLRQTASRRQEDARNQLRTALASIEQLKGTLSEKEQEIADLHEQLSRKPECRDQGSQVELAHRSIGTDAPVIEHPVFTDRSVGTDPPVLNRTVAAGTSTFKVSGCTHREPISLATYMTTDYDNACRKSVTSRKRFHPSENKTAVDLAAHALPPPPHRLTDLNTVPELSVDLPVGTEGAIFTRLSLSKILGGACQSLIVKITKSATPLAKKWGVDGFLCAKLGHNPWLPSGPGKHGIYLVERLTKEEWATLPDRVKETYADCTIEKEKSKNHGTRPQVLAKYESGELRAPCVRLQCIEFRNAFYAELVEANKKFFGDDSSPAPPSAKRRKTMELDSSDEEDIPLSNASSSQPTSVTQPSEESISPSTRSALKRKLMTVRIPGGRTLNGDASSIIGEDE
ncbi:hypothetical protein A0H81_00906 [Grifola frondosa]|uniref:Uncharacterized protein n=1 Tax=Grifola frondosa TaxID=5627 RepID=A0A1C7MQF4_GRIFR|nr:hypothetical protein A0H81_00906 [Grifola frondosa]